MNQLLKHWKKNIIGLCIACALFTAPLHGQAPNPAPNKEAMQKLAGWVGRWQGEGTMQMGPGGPKKSVVDERIELKLDGTILVVEGIGKATDATTKLESVVHHAFGIISFDASSKNYRFKSYTKEGRSADSYFNIISDNKYEWGFDIPTGGKTRYTIVLDPAKKSWNEVGEFSRDGTNWLKFFEMNLLKIE